MDIETIDKIFRYFPPTHAIARANEALVLRGIDFPKPVMDLGCGDGQFALLTFGRGFIDTGVDISPVEIAKARKSRAYRRVNRAKGSKLPFNNQSFASILSNSVLEHIEDLDQTLAESSRVLKKGGLLIITVPTPLVSDYQYWSKFIPGWAIFKVKLWRHKNYADLNFWRRALKKAGFEIVKVSRTNSKQAIKWADILFPLYLFGPVNRLIPFLTKLGVFGLSKDGATLVITARKND